MSRSERTRPALRPPGRYPHRTWWLLAKSESCRTEVLTVNGDGKHILPAFSGEGEAELFLFLGRESFGRGWHVRETSAGELVSLLSGPYAGVRSVALDPTPGMVEAGTIGLVSVGRSRFVRQVFAALRNKPALTLSKPAGRWPSGCSEDANQAAGFPNGSPGDVAI